MKEILLFIFVTIVLKLNAQQGFINSYNFGYPTPVQFDAMLLDDSELILCGFLSDSVPPYQQGVIFARIDTSGNVLSHKVHFDSLGYDLASGVIRYSGGLLKLHDNSGYLFTGSLIQGSDGFLMKLDLEGNLIWYKYLEDAVSSQGRYLHLLETETGFLIAGVKQIPQDLMNDIFVIKTDKEGNFIWEKQYGETGKSDIIRSLIMVNNNEYLLVGSKNIFNFGGSQIQVFGVDSLGIEQWYWETTQSTPSNVVENAGCIGLHQIASGDWVHATARWEYQSNTSWYAQAQFVVRDNNFNVITERVYDDVDGQTNHFYNLIQLSDGDWLGTGSNVEETPPPSPIYGHNYAWMVRISNGEDGTTSLGDSLWSRRDLAFPDSIFETGHYLHSAVELPGGNIIVAGYVTAFGAIPDHGLLIKVNQHGCTDFDNCSPTNLLNADTVIYLSTCDTLEVGSEQYVYPDQNGADSVVTENTTLIPLTASPIPPADIVLPQNAPPFTLTIPEVADAVAYAWSVPTGVQILSGADSVTVTIQWDNSVVGAVVCVSALNECGNSSTPACLDVLVDFTDEVREINQKSYVVFPNPADEVLHIVFEEEGRSVIALLDVLGKEVLNTNFTSREIEIETGDLPAGFYWLRMTSGERVFWEQVEVLR